MQFKRKSLFFYKSKFWFHCRDRLGLDLKWAFGPIRGLLPNFRQFKYSFFSIGINIFTNQMIFSSSNTDTNTNTDTNMNKVDEYVPLLNKTHISTATQINSRITSQLSTIQIFIFLHWNQTSKADSSWREFTDFFGGKCVILSLFWKVVCWLWLSFLKYLKWISTFLLCFKVR